jgi:hypothetical protein
MYNIKYYLSEIKEFNRPNPLYLDMIGCTCYLAYFNVGERGLFLYERLDDPRFPHRIHTSEVKDVTYTRGNQVIVTTQNTRFTFTGLLGKSGNK